MPALNSLTARSRLVQVCFVFLIITLCYLMIRLAMKPVNYSHRSKYAEIGRSSALLLLYNTLYGSLEEGYIKTYRHFHLDRPDFA